MLLLPPDVRCDTDTKARSDADEPANSVPVILRFSRRQVCQAQAAPAHASGVRKST